MRVYRIMVLWNSKIVHEYDKIVILVGIERKKKFYHSLKVLFNSRPETRVFLLRRIIKRENNSLPSVYGFGLNG